MTKRRLPRTLREALGHFSDAARCLEIVASLRWPSGVRCPGCGGRDAVFLPTRQLWKCRREHRGRQFSAKIGTVFEDSPITMDKWLAAIWMVANRPEETTAQNLTRTLEMTPKTASFMLQRIQLAMNTEEFEKLAYPEKAGPRAGVIRLPQARGARA